LELIALEPPGPIAENKKQPAEVAGSITNHRGSESAPATPPEHSMVESGPGYVVGIAGTNPVPASLTKPAILETTISRTSEATQTTAVFEPTQPAISVRLAEALASAPSTTQASTLLPTAVWWVCGSLAVIIILLTSLLFTLKRTQKIIPRALLTEGD